MPEVNVQKVEISANEKFLPYSSYRRSSQFSRQVSFVCISLEHDEVHSIYDEVSQSSGTQRNAAEVLMASARKLVLPAPLMPPEGKELRKDQEMYNDVLCKIVRVKQMSLYYTFFNSGQLETMGAGWSPCSKQTGGSFVYKLTQALWYIDPHHSKFAQCGIHLPECFSIYQGYNDFKRKEPRLSKDAWSNTSNS